MLHLTNDEMILVKKAKLVGIKSLMTILFAFTLSAVYAQQDQPASDQPQAREDFSEAELQQFVDVAGEVMKVQMESEQKMVKAIEDADMDIQRFNELAQAHQAQDTTVQASPEEMASFNNAAQNIMQIQQNMATVMEQTIKESGMEPNTFQDIMVAYQSSPTVKEKIDTLMKSSREKE